MLNKTPRKSVCNVTVGRQDLGPYLAHSKFYSGSIYNCTLTDSEINSLYNNRLGRFYPQVTSTPTLTRTQTSTVTSGLTPTQTSTPGCLITTCGTGVFNFQSGISYSGSGSTVIDQSACNNNGTISNYCGRTMTYCSSTCGGVFCFPGCSNIALPNNSDFTPGTGDYTISGWFCFNGSLGDYPVIFSRSCYANNYFVTYITNGGACNGKIGSGAYHSGPNAFSNCVVCSNVWNHFAAVRKSGYITVYLNGEPGTPVQNTCDINN